MTKTEINQRIFQLEGNIADAEKRKTEAEKNIRQLDTLSFCCNDYQTEFESVRSTRKVRLADFNKISGQARLVGAYEGALEGLLDGLEYISAYDSVDMAKSEISQEIERQRQVINECNSQIADFSSSINYWRQISASVDKEAKYV